MLNGKAAIPSTFNIKPSTFPFPRSRRFTLFTVNTVNPRRKIVTAAQQIHRRHGIDAVSMRSVAAAVGVTAPSLYRHFRDKEELLGALVEAGHAQLEEYLAAPPPGPRRVSAMMRQFLRFAFDHTRLYELMFLSMRRAVRHFPDDFAAGKSRTFELLRQAVAEQMKGGSFRQDDPLETTLTIWSHAHGLISMYTLGRFIGGDDEFLRYYDRSMRRILNGIRKGR